MSKRSDKQLIGDILESSQKILRYTKSMDFVDFSHDDKTIDAVIRNFEIIGEATNKLSDTFKENNDIIDWFKIRGFRNRIVHDYMGVDLSIVWNIIESILPQLILHIEVIDKTLN